ncbi:MAG: MlaC/ttg2D family ABC transporter substrate-binding protein [Planctomycetota bacterium]|jgi:phospholipid transport system substrate-binding protein
MKHRKVMFVMLISIFVITVNQSYLWSGEPGALVKEVILKESSLNKIEDMHERKAKQWDAISSSFNFEKISQRVMGEYWNKCLYEQRSGFVELFTSHLKSSYVKKANSLFGKKIISLKEKQFNKFAKVQTTLLTKSGKEVSADFYLLRENGKWQICDLIMEGVSLVNNYHSQITNTIVRTSYEELLDTMKEKQDKAKRITAIKTASLSRAGQLKFIE